MIRTVAICGVGLIGGSFALALRKAGFDGEITGVSSRKTIENALAAGVVDRGVTLAEAAAQADLIYLAQPISVILETLPLLDLAKPTALITDAGSTKKAIVEVARRPGRAAQFLGGHPMAGKEVQGVQNADAELFLERSYFLTPESDSEAHSSAALEFQEWLRKIRCKVYFASPDEHDRIVAYTSHLAQLVSTALARVVEAGLGEKAAAGAGPGLQDMTRLAMSSYGLWVDILATNRNEIDSALAAYIEHLTDIRVGLQGGLENQFKSASIFAKSLRNR